jgi:uncharacterized membrane protein
VVGRRLVDGGFPAAAAWAQLQRMNPRTEAAERSDPLAEPSVTRTGAPRLDAIDLLRGLVIVLMVLDHTRDFFHVQALAFDPTDLTRSDPALFLTRWVTHLCAPTFVFLAGASVWLQRANKSPAALSRFLLTRGLWLIALELTVVSFGFNFAAPFVFLQVIWAIGVGMVALALLVWAPPAAVLALGCIIVAGHQLLAPIDAPALGGAAPLWRVAMEPGLAGFAPGLAVYPAVPWFGVLCLGYGLGSVFAKPPAARRRLTLLLGLGALALFALLRALNGYGDPRPWDGQDDGLLTALSFLNVSKYPPSLLYVLVTLGASMLLMLALERLRGPLAALLLAFGRTPLFTYLLHVYLLHGLAMATGAAMGVEPSAFSGFLADPSRLIAAGWGVGLPVVYVIWFAVCLALYPASRWYAGVKRRRRDWWLGYL